MHHHEPGSRARSFGAVAAAYAAHRPGYPDEAVAWALAPVAVGSPHVLDLGAGTGKLSEALAGRAEVTAVDPDPAMLDELRARLPGVRALVGGAEDVPLPAAAVDAVLVGQAWHWFDRDRATAEIVRVLRPGGVLALVRNDEDPDAPLLGPFLRADPLSAPEVGHDHGRVPPVHDLLGEVTQRRFPNPRPTDVDAEIARLGTYSWMLAADPAERAAFERRVRDHLGDRPGRFTLPLVTTVQRAQRR
ncbi:class I SAM-dependent methyltransferase [Pseudonocardia hydrocarbonoxydans]|uniref:class I SAM-dependent methyltransferase n=1 Tax=Pseudonocardia hydrocarbonoxydans TaxID=76726 RepID=UPI0011423507|nr:class I SAM-dependent methyltransferase [Pseudonocardia hydrocarbonoxydans]